MSIGVPCMILRCGSSKGAYFLHRDLPDDKTERYSLLQRIMGSPDARQIDGIVDGLHHQGQPPCQMQPEKTRIPSR